MLTSNLLKLFLSQNLDKLNCILINRLLEHSVKALLQKNCHYKILPLQVSKQTLLQLIPIILNFAKVALISWPYRH